MYIKLCEYTEFKRFLEECVYEKNNVYQFL